MALTTERPLTHGRPLYLRESSHPPLTYQYDESPKHHQARWRRATRHATHDLAKVRSQSRR